MINPLVVESLTLHEEEIYYRYNFVPNNFKECDLDLKIASIQIDLDIFIQNFVCGDGKMCFCRSNALIPCSFCDSKINIIVLINGCLHNGPVICPRLVIMAHEYSKPTTMCTCKTGNFPINIRNQQLFD